jgi:hypothetical protein
MRPAGQDPGIRQEAGIECSTAPIAQESQRFLDNVIAGLGQSRFNRKARPAWRVPDWWYVVGGVCPLGFSLIGNRVCRTDDTEARERGS